jgi:hypothetical protein
MVPQYLQMNTEHMTYLEELGFIHKSVTFREGIRKRHRTCE